MRANDPPRLFQDGGDLVRMLAKADGPIATQPLTVDRLRHEIARAADWYQTNGGGAEIPAKPPKDVAADMLADPAPPLPRLEHVVSSPIFLPTGELLVQPGYHEQEAVYYKPSPGLVVPAIPEQPSPQQVEAARNLIVDEFLGDFPFTSEAERAHAVSMMLLPPARMLIDGPTPQHLVEKPTPGTGATLMSQSICSVWSDTIGTLNLGTTESEITWSITATLKERPMIVFLDNIRILVSAALSEAITSSVWQARIVGSSRLASLPVRCIWIATGNNPTLSQEIVRRTIRIRLDANVERPWERTRFRHSDLTTWVRDNRPQLMQAALTLIQARIVRGRPDGSASLGMFESWARVMGGVLSVAEIGGFLANSEDFYGASDQESRVWIQFFARWWKAHEDRLVGVNGICGLLLGSDPLDLGLGEGNEHSLRTKLGRMLIQMRDCQFGPFRLRSAGLRHGAQQWRLERGR